MKVAIVGSRTLQIDDIEEYLPDNVTEIVSGGAKGVDSCAKAFAKKQNLKYTEFIPQYEKYRQAAPLKRNDSIIEYSDMIIIFWDGKSKGTQYVKEKCAKDNKEYKLILKEV